MSSRCPDPGASRLAPMKSNVPRRPGRCDLLPALVTEKRRPCPYCRHGLRHAAGFIQAKLARRLQTRYTPLVSFVLDEGVKKSIEMIKNDRSRSATT